MWPEPGEALDRTIEVEDAVADLYAEALRRWAPTARAAVLPSLTAAAGDQPPPDPNAVASTQDAWDAIAAAVILTGLGLVWAVAYAEAADALGIERPDVDPDAPAPPELDPAVLKIVTRTSDADARDVRADYARVHASPQASAAVDEFVAARRPLTEGFTGLVRETLTAAVNNLSVEMTTRAVVVDNDALRARADSVLDAAGPEMRALARREGYQAAGVMNHAIIAAAQNASDAAELEKTWIATLDGKTRKSHWAADGQRAALAGTFKVGGEHLRFPGDPHGTAAEVKNCRCRVGVLAKDEALPDEVDRHTERLDGRDSVAINRDGRTQAEEIERRADDGNIRARDDPDGIGQVASGGWAAPSEQEMSMAPTTALADGAVEAETYLTFTDALFAVVGTPTSDRRILSEAAGPLKIRDTPLPIQFCERSEGEHKGSVTVGVAEALRLNPNGEIRGDGYMLNNEHALQAIDLLAHGVNKPSIDYVAEEIPTYEDGTPVTDENYDPNKPIFRTNLNIEVLAATIVAIPAFGQTYITLNEQREPRDTALAAAVIASYDGPRLMTYAPEMFEDPKLTCATRPTMNNDTGRIYGHLAEWGHKIRGGRMSTPRNRNGYLNFHTSQVQLDNGKQLSVGRLTVEGGHASIAPGTTMAMARAHYDDVCKAFGLVRVGEDRFGIWFSGVPAPGVTPEVFQAGMTAALSGDWRDCGAGLDMIAAHAVNSPGYPIYSAATGPDGRDLALVASFAPSNTAAGGFSLDNRDALKAFMVEVVETVDQRAADRASALAAANDRQERVAAALSAAQETVTALPPEPTPSQRIAELLGHA